MKIKLQLRALVSIILVFTVSVIVCTASVLNQKFGGIPLETAKKINEISKLVENDYYLETNPQQLNDSIVSGYVNGLGDKYAAYYNLDSSSQQADALNGDSHGIGIIAVDDMYTNSIYVWKVYRGSPAATAGIQEGDRIIKVGSNNVSDIGFNKAVENIFGSAGKTTKLSLLRNKKEFTTKVTCAYCDVQSVFSYTQGNVGVVQVINFNKKTALQFKAEIDLLLKSNVKSLIIDLRHNTGGTVTTAADMLDFILPECDTIHVKYKSGEVQVRNRSDKNCMNLPIVILTDGSTASSSEIFTSVMKEQKRAVVIGGKTYGKSLIQRNYALSDNTRVKFTVGEFVPASGESYSGIGIAPDIEVDPNLSLDYDYYFLTPESDKVLQAALKYIG